MTRFQDLDKAKKVIVDLEASLKAERSQLRALTTEQNRMQREKADVLAQLKRTESVSFLIVLDAKIIILQRTWVMLDISFRNASRKITS